MIVVKVGQGIYYNAIRDGVVTRVHGDEDRPEDRLEAKDEEGSVEIFNSKKGR